MAVMHIATFPKHIVLDNETAVRMYEKGEEFCCDGLHCQELLDSRQNLECW